MNTFDERKDQLIAEFQKEYPIETPEGLLEFDHLRQDIKTTNTKLMLGFTPVFKITTRERDFLTATEENTVRHFKGSFTAVRNLPNIRSKYQPHQGSKEIQRRLKRAERSL